MNTKKLQKAGEKRIKGNGKFKAAVIVPIVGDTKNDKILFTKRTDWLNEHPGQISFPGGRYQREDENLKKTAVRETTEEIGIHANDIEIIGQLNDCKTITGYTITPFVAKISKKEYVRNEDEVAEIFECSVERLMERNNFESKECIKRGEHMLLPYFYVEDHVIWGATARILLQLLENTTEWKG